MSGIGKSSAAARDNLVKLIALDLLASTAARLREKRVQLAHEGRMNDVASSALVHDALMRYLEFTIEGLRKAAEISPVREKAEGWLLDAIARGMGVPPADP